MNFTYITQQHAQPLAPSQQAPLGELFISQEFLEAKGTLLHRSDTGQLKEVLNGLSKPDGLAWFAGGLVVGQEGGRFPQRLQGERRSALFEAERLAVEIDPLLQKKLAALLQTASKSLLDNSAAVVDSRQLVLGARVPEAATVPSQAARL